MLIYAASGCSDRRNVGSRVANLARRLAPHARCERVLVDIALHPALAFKFAVPHILLTRLGHPDPTFDEFLKSCVTSQTRHGHDRTPTAVAERDWIRSVWTGSNPDAQERLDLRDSLLAAPIDILGGLRDDGYAFTHLLFYATDFGFRPCRMPRSRATMFAEAASLLARFVDAEDYDLAAEILLAWPLTRARWSASATFSLRVLARAEDEVGVLPCGNVDLQRLAGMEGESRFRYALGTAYHTAYMMGVLCAVSLRPGATPPSAIVGPRFDNACISALFPYVGMEQGHWQDLFASLPEEEQRMLVPFVLDIAIVQNYRRHNYQALQEILTLLPQYGIPAYPICQQVAEFLARIRNCSTALDSLYATRHQPLQSVPSAVAESL